MKYLCYLVLIMFTAAALACPTAVKLPIMVGKLYQDRALRPVRIYATDGGGAYPVHGARLREGVWEQYSWTLGGCADVRCVYSEFDLMERE